MLAPTQRYTSYRSQLFYLYSFTALSHRGIQQYTHTYILYTHNYALYYHKHTRITTDIH